MSPKFSLAIKEMEMQQDFQWITSFIFINSIPTSSQTIGGTTINFTYDASGNRTSKTLSNGYKEFYVRDAGGNVMSIYRSSDAWQPL